MLSSRRASRPSSSASWLRPPKSRIVGNRAEPAICSTVSGGKKTACSATADTTDRQPALSRTFRKALTPEANAQAQRERDNALTSPFRQVIEGGFGVLHDSTIGAAGNLWDDLNHLDEIPDNFKSVTTALTHPDLTLRVATEDLGRGFERFGQLPLDEQIRLAGDSAMAGLGGVGLGRGAPAIERARPAVIGESMERVNATAGIWGKTYKGFKNSERLGGEDLASARAAHDTAWMDRMMNEGRTIIDRGPAPGRAKFPGVTSDAYAIELLALEQRQYLNIRRLLDGDF